MSWLADIADYFFPRYCVVCGEALSGSEQFLCAKCLIQLPRTNLHLQSDNDVEKNLWGKIPLGKASAYLYYHKKGMVSKLIASLKYQGNAALGVFLGRCMATDLIATSFFSDIDFIVPLPLHKTRRKKRGYNQSEQLALGISSVTNIPIRNDIVVRKRDTDTQTSKSEVQRWENLQDSFECVSPEPLVGKHILLVDDVMTTGATVVACADAFDKTRQLKISVLTLSVASDM
ncbi:MAG: ComF family protein [Bacteroidales bacterium]|nr:ComF family protein [Bacteroidales bacterium]